MPRPSGKHGLYGLTGSSVLALRRRREVAAERFVCRICDLEIAKGERAVSFSTPYHRFCMNQRATERRRNKKVESTVKEGS
jgi:hypothetical protein